MSHTGPLSIMFMSSQCLPHLRHPYYVQVVCLCGAWWVSKLQLTEDDYITLQEIQLHILQQSAELVLARIFCVLHPCLSISRTIFLLWAWEGLPGDLTPPGHNWHQSSEPQRYWVWGACRAKRLPKDSDSQKQSLVFEKEHFITK